MNIGKSMKGMRNRKELSQSNVAGDMFVDQTMISKIEKGQRSATKELARESVGLYDDAQYGFEVARETARDYITPLVIANQSIEWHRLALEEVFINEAREAIEHFEKVSLVKRPELSTDEEIRSIEEGIKELLDVQTTINSFLAKLEQVYPVSVKDCMRKRISMWKAKGWTV